MSRLSAPDLKSTASGEQTATVGELELCYETFGAAIAPDQIQAIEFYAGPAETPSEYQTLNSDCGVLVIWTRTP